MMRHKLVVIAGAAVIASLAVGGGVAVAAVGSQPGTALVVPAAPAGRLVPPANGQEETPVVIGSVTPDAADPDAITDEGTPGRP